MSQTLIILGASARAAAFSARRAGFGLYAIDQFADRDLVAICPAVRIKDYPHDFLAALRAAPDAPWIYTGGLENLPRLIDSLARIRPLWGNSGSVLRLARDPRVVEQASRDAGLSMPPMRRSLSKADVADGSIQWLIKPQRSSGGHRARPALPGPQPSVRGSYYQQWIHGRPHGAVFVANRGRCKLLGISEQLTGSAGPFIYGGSIAGTDDAPERRPRLVRLGEILTERCGLRGLFNVDFIRNVDGDWPLEVNPRYSASVEVLERATRQSLLALHVAAYANAAAGDSPSLTLRVTGKAIVYAESDGRVLPELDQLVRKLNRDAERPDIADLPAASQEFFRGQPLCTVFADGQSADEVRRALADRCDEVQRALRPSAACNSASPRP